MRLSKRTKTSKTLNKSKWLHRILGILLCFFFLFLLFVKLTSFSKVITMDIREDELFKKDSSKKDNFGYLQFTLAKDFEIKNLKYIFPQKNLILEIDLNTYIKYDSNYYLFKDALNTIKQRRSENANTNLLYLIQDIIGLKVDSYIYNFQDQNTYYTNNKDFSWSNILNNSSYSRNLINKNKVITYNTASIKIYDFEENDSVIKNLLANKKNVNLEIYNSTSIDGYGYSVSRLLNNEGFTVVRVFNYTENYSQSTLFINSNLSKFTEDIQNILGLKVIKDKLPSNINSIADDLIILGGDTYYIY
jgi:hypothetical protein